MKMINLVETTADWLKGDAEQGSSIVLSSRMRLARNLVGYAFPTWAKKAEREKVLSVVKPAVLELAPMKNPLVAESMENFSVLDKQILVEQHLISREHAAKSGGSGVVVNHDRSLSIMIDEEDHLRMQAFKPGLQLDAVWKMIDKVDTELDEKLHFAFSDRYGYLTACPTNVGTGMRASAMLHLPALVLADQINPIVQAVGKLGLAVRGLYGEGTEALGNLFQVSNQMTLGESEAEIIERLNKVITQIVEHEENARATLLEKSPRVVADQVGRAYGVLTNCRSISSKEALNLLSLIRLGTEMEIFMKEASTIVNELMIVTQPAHLQFHCEQKLSAEDRDGLRADLIREKLSVLKRPDMNIVKPIKKGKQNE
jgi:protein arginine kinase